MASSQKSLACLQHEVAGNAVQGYLAHEKQRPTRTLQKDSAQGPMVALGEGAVSYERGTPAERSRVAGRVPASTERERIFIALMTSDRKLKASREGSK